MKAVLQRVARATVTVEDRAVGSIGAGVLVYLGVMRGDGPDEVRRLADRLARFRFFEDGDGRMNLSVLDTGGEALVVSQFTLAADGKKGRRPSFDRAAPPEEAEPLYEAFLRRLGELGVPCAAGRFGARMAVDSVNDGPVTFVLEEAPAAEP